MALEILNFAFVSLGGGTAGEGPEVAALARLRILLPRIEAKLAVLKLPDHEAITPGGSESFFHSKGFERAAAPGLPTGIEPSRIAA
jgi:hypothetical protein